MRREVPWSAMRGKEEYQEVLLHTLKQRTMWTPCPDAYGHDVPSFSQ
jgi:hypothetical protein